MSIKVSQAFERTSANPIDASLALSQADMLTVNDNLMPDYYFTICQDDGYIYLYDKSATASATTGKFTKFEGGSGTGGSYTYLSAATLDTDINDVTTVDVSDLTQVDDSTVIPTLDDITVGVTIIYDAKGTIGLVTDTDDTNDTVDVTTASNSKGHTIQDTDGTSMAQEDNLQFIGLDVQDDSTNEATTVESFGLNSDDLDDIATGSIAYRPGEGNSVSVGTRYYVDADNGDDDANDGLSINYPFKSLQRAVNACAEHSIATPDFVTYTDEIRVNTSATAAYDRIVVYDKYVRIRAWDFTNDVDLSTTAGTTLTITTSTGDAIYLLRAWLVIYCPNVTLTSTTGRGINCDFGSALDHNSSDVTACAMNFTINCQLEGITLNRQSYAIFRGRCDTSSTLTITSNYSGSTTTWGLAMYNSSTMEINGSLAVTAGSSSGGGGIGLFKNSTIVMNNTGASASYLCKLNIQNNGISNALRCDELSVFRCASTYSYVKIVNTSTATTPLIQVLYNSHVTLFAYSYLYLYNNSTSSCIVAQRGGTIDIGSSAVTGTRIIHNPTSGTTVGTVQANRGGIITLIGASSTYPITIQGVYGLQASSGDIKYASITNNATTATSTGAGGRIYTGSQSSVPNY